MSLYVKIKKGKHIFIIVVLITGNMVGINPYENTKMILMIQKIKSF